MQNEFLDHLGRANDIGIQNTPFRQWKRWGGLFSLLSPPSLPCLSPHLPDPASPQPAQQSERISVVPTGGGGIGERLRESQIKVVKRRRNEEGVCGNNRRVTDQILSDRMREEDGCREEKKRGGGEKMRIYMRWPVL